MFEEDIRSLDGYDLDEDDLAAKLPATARRLLPGLRLYSVWVIPAVHLISGLSSDDLLRDAVIEFWSIYAVAIDVVAEVFPIWDLEELPALGYLLEEDVDTLGFKPLEDKKTTRNWIDTQTGTIKPRFSDRAVVRLSQDEEMLARVKDFLTDGLYLANNDNEAPIKLDGTRIYYGTVPERVNLRQTAEKRQKREAEQAARAAEARKPLSYAAAAARTAALPSLPNGESSNASSRAQQARLSRMVDELVDDDDGNNPVTPPQQYAANPAVVTNGDITLPSNGYTGQDFAHVPSHQPKMPSTQRVPSAVSRVSTPPSLRTPKYLARPDSVERLQSVSSLWNDPMAHSTASPNFPSGLPMGTLSSPAQITRAGHSRVNSASSIRSRASQNIGDSWSSLESAPRVNGVPPADGYTKFSASGMASPLLFGAGRGMWSTVPTDGYRGTSPPNGQGG